MKSPFRRFSAICAVVMASVALSASAGVYNKVEYSTSTDIEPGKWFSTFQSVLNYANENNVPMVVFWGNKDCGHCQKVEESIGGSSEFKKWMAESGIVFAYVINRKNVPGDGSVSKLAKRYSKSGTNYPFLGVYWKENSKGKQVGGKMGENASSYDGHYCADGWNWKKVMNTIKNKLADWSPEKGGEFNFTESEGNRYEIEAGSTGVEVTLTRRAQAAEEAYTNTVEVILPDGSVKKESLIWPAGASSTNYVVTLPDISGLKDGDTVTIRMDGNDRNTLPVHYVAEESGSAANPLWKTERTAPVSAAKKLLGASKPLVCGEWTMDLDGAKALAKAKKGYVLVSVQGSLWCPDCANTERNFLNVTNADGENVVRAWAAKNNVALAVVDIPNFTGPAVTDYASPTLLSRTVYTYPHPLARKEEYPQSGADKALTEVMPRSGLAYLTRKGITDEEAAKMLARNHDLVTKNTSEGGFHRPEDGNAFRTGVPIFVLLDSNGNVAGRLTRLATKSPMMYDAGGKLIATAERTENILKRVEELMAIADVKVAGKADDPDFTEVENNYPSVASPVAKIGGAAVSGRISHADFQDTFKLEGMTGNAQVYAMVTNAGTSDAAVKAELLKLNDDGSVTTVGSTTGRLSQGLKLLQDAKTAGDYFVRVTGADITSAEFDVYSKDSTVVQFTVQATLAKLIPGEDAATVSAADGTVLKVDLEAGTTNRFLNVKAPAPAGLTHVGEGGDLYLASVSETVDITVSGDFTYQKWVPGEVGFFPDEPKSVKETSGDLTVRFGRSGGRSGDVTVRAYVDREETDYFYDPWPGEATYKQLPRFSIDGAWDFLPADTNLTFETNIVYKESADLASCSNAFRIGFEQIAELKKYYGDGKIVLKLEVLSGDAKVKKGVYTINVTETSSSKPGTVYMKAADPFFAKGYTVYARKSSTVDIVLGRATACQGLVRTKFTQSKGGTLLLSGDPESSTNAWEKTFSQVWWNHDDEDKTITVTNLPAVGKSVTLTLAPVKPFKISSKKSNAVTVVSVADDALEFAACEYGFTNLIRYVACELPCPLSEDYPVSGISLTAKKLSGSVPSGLTAKVVKDDDGKMSLVFSGVPTKAVTSCSAVYQLVENRGTKKNPKNFASLPVKVTFRVVDPTTAGASEDPAIAAIANPAIKTTRTLSDLMVWGSNTVGRLAGKLTLTIPATGKVSAKYTCSEGTIAFSAKSWSEKMVGEEDADGTYTAVLTPTKSAYRDRGYELTVNAFANSNVTATVIDPLYEGTEFSAYSDGRVWTAGNAKKKIPAHTAANWKGLYTITLMPAGTEVVMDQGKTAELPGSIDEAIEGLAPRGAGYLTLNMASSSSYNAGTVKWAGRLANGTSVSGTTVLTEGVEDFIGMDGFAYLPLYTRVATKVSKSVSTLDRLAAIIRIEPDPSECPRAVMPAEELARGEWTHTVTKPTTTKALDYRMDVFLLGSYYDKAKSLGACCEEKSVSVNQKLVVDTLGAAGWIGAGLPLLPVDPVAVTVVTNKSAKYYSKDTLKVSEPSATNIRQVKITSFNRSTGVVTGTFKLPYADASGNERTVTANWRGVVLSGWGCGCGCGDPPESLDLGSVILPFVNGCYTFSDTVVYDVESGKKMAVLRGGQAELQDAQ